MAQTIKELEEALKAARLSEQAEGDTAIKAWKPVYKWLVVWNSEYRFHIRVEITLDSAEQLEALKKQYPKSAHRAPYLNQGGMEHVLVGNALIRAGGGLVVIKRPGVAPGFSFDELAEPIMLSDGQVAELKAGRVPDELKTFN